METLEWEFPTFVQGELRGLLTFLGKFLPEQVGQRTLRRASAPPSPEPLPRLTDPAANDPRQVDAVNDRFASRLSSWLEDGEQFKAWALWPAWFDKRSAPEVLLVTDQRIGIISDSDRPVGCKLEISLADLATLEYASSILNSYIGLSWVLAGQAKRSELKFPYSAESAFRSCMEAIRRCMAVLACR